MFGDWENISGGPNHITASVNNLWVSTVRADLILKYVNGQNWVHVNEALRQVDADDHEVRGVNGAYYIYNAQ